MELMKDGQALTKAIRSIKQRGAALDADIQSAGLSAVWHVAEHGNVGYVNSLYMALGQGARHVALTAWLLAFGGVRANTGKNKDTMPFVFAKDKEVDLESANAKPWFAFKPSAAPNTVVDLFALIERAIKAAGKEGVTEIRGAEHLDTLRSIVAAKHAKAAADAVMAEEDEDDAIGIEKSTATLETITE